MTEPSGLRKLRAGAVRDGRSVMGRVIGLEAQMGELAARHRRIAAALVKVARHGNLSGADALRSIVGSDEALALLQAAGEPAAQWAGRWAEERQEREREIRQTSVKSIANSFGRDPTHDAQVLRLLMAGHELHHPEVQAALKAAAERIAETTQQSTGPRGGSALADIQPTVTTVPHRDWSEFPDHQSGYDGRTYLR